MRRVIYMLFLCVAVFASFFGLNQKTVHAGESKNLHYAIDDACDSGLIYSDVISKQNKLIATDACPYGHYSHRSHSSHSSHRSHYSHYSGY